MTALSTLYANQDKDHQEKLRAAHARAVARAVILTTQLKQAAKDYAEQPTSWQREVWLVEAAKALTNARHQVGRLACKLGGM